MLDVSVCVVSGESKAVIGRGDRHPEGGLQTGGESLDSFVINRRLPQPPPDRYDTRVQTRHCLQSFVVVFRHDSTHELKHEAETLDEHTQKRFRAMNAGAVTVKAMPRVTARNEYVCVIVASIRWRLSQSCSRCWRCFSHKISKSSWKAILSHDKHGRGRNPTY